MWAVRMQAAIGDVSVRQKRGTDRPRDSLPRPSDLCDAPPYGPGQALPLFCCDQPLEPTATASVKGVHTFL